MFRRLLLAVVFTFLAGLAHAQVSGSLVAVERSVQPGRPFTVALRLQHDPHWHTYWINPGTGYPTSLSWTLPPGWTAGDIQWPAPIVIKDPRGNIAGNGYEGVLHLPVTITPPADARAGETVVLRAKAEWLMCEAVCVPGEADLTLSLPVATGTPETNPDVAAAVKALPMPQPTPPAWRLSATRRAGTVTLSITGAGATTPEAPHVFTEDGLVAYDQPQVLRTIANGFELTLPVSDAAEPASNRLQGVLTTANPLCGYTLDLPLETATAADRAGAGSTSGTAATDAPPAPGLAGILAFAFLGGLILNLMPCVFPVLGIKILGFVNQSGSDRRKVTLHGVVFTLGVLASFWFLAGLLAVLRSGGAELGWGFQLQSATFVYVLALVMLVFAMSMSGVFEFGLRATGVGADLQAKSGYTGSFFTGVLATVVATPCSAPFLAPALGVAVTLPTAQSFVAFTVIALGLSVPYLLLSIFPDAIRLLPRPGAWMETFKQFMAFPLYATVAFLAWVLAGQTSEQGLLYVLLGITLVALGVWWYGRYTAPGAKPGRVRAGVIGGLLLCTGGIALGWPRDAAPSDIVWEPWSAEKVAELQKARRTIYVDFTARWCFTCQTNKKVVFSSDEVKRVFREKNVATLKADWTNRDPRITAELAKWGRSAVPFNLIYKPGASEPVILPELLTPGSVLEHLE